MQEDVLAVRSLWQIDEQIRVLRGQLRALDKVVDDAAAHMTRLAEEDAALVAQRKALRLEEGTLQARLDDYIRRRDRSKLLLETGGSADFIAAERQMNQCAEIVEQLEVQVFALMEQTESLDGKRVELGRSQTLWQARHREALADRDRAAPPLQTELDALLPQREARHEAVNRSDRQRYEELRRRGHAPFAYSVDNACSACRMVVAQQVTLEVTRGTYTHHCRGCKRWLVVPEEMPT